MNYEILAEKAVCPTNPTVTYFFHQ